MTSSLDVPAVGAVTQPESEETAGRPVVPVLADGVELLGELPGSGYRRTPSLVRRADGQTLQVTPLLYGVLSEIDGVRDYPEIAARLSDRVGKTASADDVRYLIEKKLQPLGVLRRLDGSQPVTQKANPLLRLRPRVVLSDPALTRRVTSPFARLFAPLVVLPMLVAFVAVTGWVLFAKGLAAATHQAFYQPGLLLTVFALTVVSAGFHEFGHAAACRRGGATPGVMGFGLYIVWPAFYTDVSDSYRLDRRRRLWVDLGGLYFNAIFGVVAFGLWLVTGWDALLLVVGLQVLQMLRQLTPVIRADGYHILADLTGVPDLFAHLGPTVRSVWPGNWRKRDSRSLKRWARIVVIVWVLLIVPSLAFALVSGAVLMPRLIATAWSSLGVQWHALTGGVGHGDYGRAVLAVLKMISVVLPVAGTLLLLGRMATRLARKAWGWTGGSRWRRGVALVAAVSVVAALGWCWWPRNQYVPVQRNEHGTLFQLPGVLSGAATGRAQPVALRSLAAPQRTSALLLVPRNSASERRPALLMLPAAAGQKQQILAIPPLPAPSSTSTASVPSDPWPFPFSPPPPAQPGDNRALTVNTTDGTATYDVSFAVVWVSGSDVTQRNDAIALADCNSCRTVSVAFQAIFILGQSDVIRPVNTSLAVNNGCRDCQTSAIAVQLVTSLTALPDPQTMADLDGIWQQLDALAAQVPNLDDQEIYARLKDIEADILTTLTRAGPAIVNAADATASQAGASGSDAPASAPPSPGSSTTSSTDGTSQEGTSVPQPSSSPTSGSTGTSEAGAGSGSASQGSTTGADSTAPQPSPSSTATSGSGSTGTAADADQTAVTGSTSSTTR